MDENTTLISNLRAIDREFSSLDHRKASWTPILNLHSRMRGYHPVKLHVPKMPLVRRLDIGKGIFEPLDQADAVISPQIYIMFCNGLRVIYELSDRLSDDIIFERII